MVFSWFLMFGWMQVGSPDGGVDIEEVAAKSPHLIFKEPIDINKGVSAEQANRLATNLGFKGDQHTQVCANLLSGSRLFH